MTVREGIAVFVAAAGLLCAVLFYRQAGDTRREADRTEEQLNRKIAGLERQLREAEDRRTAQPPSPEPPRAEILPEELPAEKIAKSNAPAAATPAAKQESSMAAMAKMRRAMANSPVMKEAMRNGVKHYIEDQYADILKEWGLEGEARDKAVEALVDRNMANSEAGMLLMDAEVPEEEVLAKIEESQRRADQILRDRFTPQQVGGLAEYEKTIPDRMATKQAEREVGDLGIDPVRAASVRDILVDEARKERDRTSQAQAAPDGSVQPTLDAIRRTRASMRGEGETPVEAMLAAKRESNSRIFDRVQPYMTPEQYDKFRAQREADLQMLEMHVQMLRATQPPESGDNR